ncbi:GldM family protein [Winogradskyella sp. PE311]|uniref:GldM family protein n=1 Tax=Winogradskyella sp. PE311 TaxID=3366943 RepID=UPI00397F70F1
MKKLFLLVILFISFSINAQENPNCILKLNKASLISMSLDCDQLKEKTITYFKLKVPGKATVTNKGSKLTNEAKKLILQAKTGDTILLFDIKLMDYKKDVAPILVTLVEYH